jgi:hypothetical protein
MNHPEIPDVAALHRGGSPQFLGAANLGSRESGNTRTSGAALMDNVDNYYVTLHIYMYISTCMYINVYYCILLYIIDYYCILLIIIAYYCILLYIIVYYCILLYIIVLCIRKVDRL